MNLWEERAARNEALFREVNEQVDSLSERQGSGAEEELLFICECSDDRCTERVAAPRAVVLLHESGRVSGSGCLGVGGVWEGWRWTSSGRRPASERCGRTVLKSCR